MTDTVDVPAASAEALDRATRVLQRNGFGHYDSQRAARALLDNGCLTDAELALVTADLVTALENLHRCGVQHERLLVDNIRLHKQNAGLA